MAKQQPEQLSFFPAQDPALLPEKPAERPAARPERSPAVRPAAVERPVARSTVVQPTADPVGVEPPRRSGERGRRPKRARPAGEVLSVASLDRLIKRMLEGSTASVRVQGEVSGLHRAGSGHSYFTLKDEREDALIECVMYRSAPERAHRRLCEGKSVVLSGRVTLYPPRGRLQFIAEAVLRTARGALLEALEALKAKLSAEGLFAPELKQSVPGDPRCLAVLTSREGAAIHDFIKVAFRRGRVRIILIPTPVQGSGADASIARAIAVANRIPAVEAIVVTRGGGSAEDLAAYNSERVVRAVVASRRPVLSAVGHEIDVSLCDLAADVRAATPSHAAELLVPDFSERRATLRHLGKRLGRAVDHQIVARQAQLTRKRAALGEPRRLVLEQAQRFDDLTRRLQLAVSRGLAERHSALASDSRRLLTQHPRRVLAATRVRLSTLQPRLLAAVKETIQRGEAVRERIPGLQLAMALRLSQERQRLSTLGPRLTTAMARLLQQRREEHAALVGLLEALSPLAVLSRGYAIATDAQGHVLRDGRQIAIGDPVLIRLRSGRLAARIEDHLDGVDPPGDD